MASMNYFLIKKSFTKILTIISSVKIVLTLRVKLPCPKCKILIVREILVLSFIVSEKNRKKRWTMYWRFDLKIREQFIVSVFSLDRVTNLFTHIDKCLLKWIWLNTNRRYKWHCCLLLFLAWLITESVYNDAFRTFTSSMQQCIVYMTKKSG